MESEVRIIRGVVESVSQQIYGTAVALVRFGEVPLRDDVKAKGAIYIYGDPVKQGEMLGVQWGDESQVWLVGSVVEIVL